MSTPTNPSPSLNSNSRPPTTEIHEFINQEEAARNRAAAERYAEVALKSKPLPEGYDTNQRATIGQAVTTIKPDDFLRVHETPCGREGMLALIVGGAGVGGLRYVLGAPVPKAANWAVYSGAALSIISYEFCQYKRRIEKANMRRVVEVISKKQAEQQKLEEEKRRQQQQLAQEPAVQPEAAKNAGKSWYKFW